MKRLAYALLMQPEGKPEGWLCDENGLIIIAETAEYLFELPVFACHKVAFMVRIISALPLPHYLAYEVETL